MWRLEKDPYLSSTVANLTVLDTARRHRPPARAGCCAATESCPGCASGCSRRSVSLQPPAWVDDADFDLDVPPPPARARRRPATMRELFDLAVAARPPTRSTAPGRCGSSWSSTASSGGRAALLQRFHHTLMDGEGGVRLSLQFLDFERDAPEKPLPPEVEPVEPPPPASAAEVAARRRDEHDARPSGPRSRVDRADGQPAAHPRDQRGSLRRRSERS